MFWSKIWFALIALAAAVFLTLAIVMPRPAQRVRVDEEKQRLAVACSVVNILMRDNARLRVELAGRFARTDGMPELLADASRAERIDQPRNQAAREKLGELLNDMRRADEAAAAEGDPKRRKAKRAPDFAIALDNRGRVVGRSGLEDENFNDSMAGLSLVDDALAGYLRDDLWLTDGKLYFMSASPVVKRDQQAYVGAVLIGHAVTTELATQFVDGLGEVNVAYYGGGKVVAASTVQSLDKEIMAAHDKLADGDLGQDCVLNPSVNVGAGAEQFTAVVARLPGEARREGAFFSVFVERAHEVGFSGTLDSVRKDDLSFGSFPWIPLALVLLLVLGGGLALMIYEADRPLRRLAADAVRLAKGEVERLDEERHRSKHGSIARSVNIQIDKLQRDARSAKKDLDQLLGPAPDEDGVGGGMMMPPMAPMRPSVVAMSSPGMLPPPPSEFKFTEAPKPRERQAVTFDRPPAPPPFGDAAPTGGAPPPFELELPPAQIIGAPPPPPPPGNITPPGLPMPAGRVRVNTPPPVAGQPPAPAASSGKTPPPVMRIRAAGPGPAPMPAPTPMQMQAVGPGRSRSIDDDILATEEEDFSGDDGPTTVADANELRANLANAAATEDSYYQTVFEQFLELKRKCGEPVAGLTFQKFAAKLRKNKEELIARHACREVRFQVYVKDGKAALKATPVKE